MKEQWLNNLKERSEAFERKTPDGLWDGVMQSLEERGVVRKKRNIMPLVLRRGMVAAAVLLSAVIGFVVLHNDEISLQKNMPKESKAVAETESVEKTASVEVVHHTLALQQPIINDRSSKYVQMAAEETKAPEQQFGDSTFVVKDSDVANKSVEEQDVRNAHSVMDNYAERQRHAGREIPGMYRGDKTSEGGNGKWSAGIYASNMTGNDASAIGYRNFRMGTNPFGNMPKQETWTTNAMANIMFNNLNKVPETKVKHHLPLRFGANVKYSLTSRWGLESGVAYTLLKSELTSGEAQDYYTSEQTIHYLGIPLKVHFTVWQNSRFRVYANAGGMMEIPLSAKVETTYVTGSQSVGSHSEDVEIDRLQWSVSGAVGIQYNFIKNLGVYIEPGVGYYFDDGNDVLTIYKDKPFNFNMQIGLRFELE